MRQVAAQPHPDDFVLFLFSWQAALDSATARWHEPWSRRPRATEKRTCAPPCSSCFRTFCRRSYFSSLYLSTDNVTLATSAAIAVGLAQVAVMKFLGRPIDAMQWLALGLVAVLGAATLDHPERPLHHGQAHRHPLGHRHRHAPARLDGALSPARGARQLPLSVTVASGYAWAALMFVLGALNLFVAVAMSFEAWAWFITVGAGGSKVVLFLAQYWLFRSIIRRNLVAQAARPQPQSST